MTTPTISDWTQISGLAVGLLPFEGMPLWEPRHLEIFATQLPGFAVVVPAFPRLGETTEIGKVSEARIRPGILEVRVAWNAEAPMRLSPADLAVPPLDFCMRWKPFELTGVHVRR